MPRLFTYTIPVDDGAAPNPFFGMCSLAICKPGIRGAAHPGDWVAGLGSKNAPSGDLSGHLVYAMQVEEVLSLRDYDLLAPLRWPHRIPVMNSPALQERLGDCIYNYTSDPPILRPSVHGPANVETDLRGRNVLLSSYFFYFGGSAIRLPEELLQICHHQQGHRSNSNGPYFERFIEWLHALNLTPGQLYGWPDFIPRWSELEASGGCTARCNENAHDPEC